MWLAPSNLHPGSPSPFRALQKRLKEAFLLFNLLVCLSPAAGAAETCRLPFSQTLPSEKILGGHVIYFSSEDLNSIWSKPGLELTQADLELEVAGKKSALSEFSVALNGLETSHPQGKPLVLFKGSKKSENQDLTVPLQELKVNGSRNFISFLSHLLAKRGIFAIWVQGPFTVKFAQITISGTERDSRCAPAPEPSASPSPAPRSPVVKLLSAQPSEGLTRTTSQTFEFSSDQVQVNFHCTLDQSETTLCASPVTYSSLQNGPHTFQVSATNSAGLVSNLVTYAWEIDTLPVDVVIDSITPSVPMTSSNTLEVTFSSNKESRAVEFQCALDDQPQSLCVSPATFSGLTEGLHSLQITARDSLGNVSSMPAHHEWRVDLTPPETTLISTRGAEPYSQLRDPIFEFQANESSLFECSLDGLEYQHCSSPAAHTALQDGQHQFSVRATDSAGNLGTAAVITWKVDTISPELILGNIVPTPGFTAADSIFVDFSANEEVSYACSLDSAPAVACTSPWRASITTEGPHQVEIRAVDLAGNESAAKTLRWIMDFTSPQIRFGDILPSAASHINSNSLSLNVLPSEQVVYRFTLDGLLLDQDSSPLDLSGLSEGPHVLIVEALDATGNAAEPLQHQFVVDTTAPEVMITTVAAKGVTRETINTFTFSANENVQFECDVDQAGYNACSSPLTVSGFAQGLHTFRVRGRDAAGNLSPAHSHSWTVDLTPPKTSLLSASPAGSTITSSSISFHFSVNDSTSTSFCRIDGGTPAPCAGQASYAGLSEGSHTFQVYSVDSAGNKECPPIQYSFIVDTKVPTVSLSANVAHLTNSAEIQFVFTADEPSLFICSLNGVVQSGCLSPQIYSGLTQGSHSFSISARDLSGNIGDPVSFNWTVDMTAPALTIEAFTDPLDHSTRSFTLTTNEVSTLVCAMDSAPWTACDTQVTYRNLEDGEHLFKAFATDLAGNISTVRSLNFVVASKIETLIMKALPSEAVTRQTAISFELGSNISNPGFLCSLDSAPPVSCASGVTYSGLSNGNHRFFVQAVSPDGKVDSVGTQHTWTVDTISPVIMTTTTSVTQTSITIQWTTNEPATSVLNWGPGGTLNQVVSNPTLNTTHAITLTGLNPSTVYSYRISGQDEAGNSFVAPARSVRTAQ